MRCELCSGPAILADASKNYKWLKCSNCSSVSFVEKFPKKISFEYAGSTKKYAVDQVVNIRWGHINALSYLSAQSRKRVVDVGCFTGEFTERIGEIGHQAFGVDINSEAIKVAKFRHKIPTFINSLTDDLPKGEVYAFIDSLEHFADLTQFQEIIEPNNAKTLIISLPEPRKLLHDRTDYPPHHMRRITTEGLVAYLGKFGYELHIKKSEYNFPLFVMNAIGVLLNKKNLEYTGEGISSNSSKYSRKISQWIYTCGSMLNPAMRILNLKHSSTFYVFCR